MLTKYLQAAMNKAHYEILKDDGTFLGTIPGFQGVYSNAATLEKCRDELEEVLEEWIFLRISRGLSDPLKLIKKSNAGSSRKSDFLIGPN